MPQIAGKEVGPIGYGLMGFTWRSNPAPQEQAFAAMRASLERGANFWNGGEFYGTPEYNSMTLLRRYFEAYPEDADKVVLSIKGGTNLATGRPDGTPEGVRRSLDNVLAQLGGRKHLDVFEYARRDPAVPLATTFGVIEEEYVKTGKLTGISLSEVSLETLEEAVKATTVVAVELELSLWSTDILDNGVAAACAKYGIPIVAYSPIGRGILTGQVKSRDDLPEMLRDWPRFQPGAFEINLQLVSQVEALAARKGCTPAQLAIGWCLALARRPDVPVVVPIPGATTAARVHENSTPVELTDEEMAEIEATLARFEVQGDRYPSHIPTNT